MADEFDFFGGETGLLDDYDGIVIDSFFSVNPERPTDGHFLTLTVQTDNPDTPEVTNRYRLGPDWQTYDGGETVAHPRYKRFQNNTQYYELIAHAFKAGAEEILRARGESLTKEDGEIQGARAASIWMGLKFHWKIVSEKYSFTNRAGDKVEGVKNRPLPSDYLGEFEVSTTEPTDEWTDPTTTTAPTSSSSSDSSESSSGTGMSDDLRTKLTAIAKTHSFEDFIDAALPLVDEDGSINPATLADEAFYSGLRS